MRFATRSVSVNSVPNCSLNVFRMLLADRIPAPACGHERPSAQRAVNRRTCVQYGLEIVRSIEITDVSGACVYWLPRCNNSFKQCDQPIFMALSRASSAA